MNGLIKILPVLMFTGILGAGCISHNREAFEKLEKGKVLTGIKCNADTTVSYALYIPPAYERGKKWPLIIAFDPHAAGRLPVSLLREEAGKRGFLVAGSENSKNGMAFNESISIYNRMLNDIKARFNIDTSLIYTLGFSGGGRVAGSLAMSEGGIAGVVSCGAGLSSTGQPPRQPFSFLGVAGTGDFNWWELATLDPQLEEAGFTHHFLDFEGKHEWPPKSIVPDIMDWIEFDAMRSGKIPVNRNAINRFIDSNDSLANSPSFTAKPYEQMKVYLKMKHYLQGLTDISALEALLSQLEKDPDVLHMKKETRDLMDLEKRLREQYGEKLREPDLIYWKNESTRLKSLAGKISARPESDVYKRVLGFLSLSAYMYSNNSLKQNNPDAAKIYIEIYRLVDPGNSEHRYLAAIVAARENRKDEVVKALSEAIELGFNDKARLLAEPDFTGYHTDAEFEALVKKL